MNKVKWVHCLTGKLVQITLKQNIMRMPDGTKRCMDANKVFNHMISQGYVRAGRSIKHTDIEKVMMEEATQIIAAAKVKAAEMRAGVEATAKLPLLALENDNGQKG